LIKISSLAASSGLRFKNIRLLFLRLMLLTGLQEGYAEAVRASCEFGSSFAFCKITAASSHLPAS
jgi:hypothetical protein